jgi:hypothetical protein
MTALNGQGSGRYTLWMSGGSAIPSSVNGVDTTVITWSQPEILLFDPTWIPLTPTSSRDPMVAWPAGSQASGYIGFYEDADGVAFIGSQKSGYELMHRIPQRLLTAVWTQHSARTVPPGALLDVAVNSSGAVHRVPAVMPGLAENGGLSVSVWVGSVNSSPAPVNAHTAAQARGENALAVSAECDGGGFALSVSQTSLEFKLTIAGNVTTIVPTVRKFFPNSLCQFIR